MSNQITYNNKQSLLENFASYIEKNRKISDIIGWLSRMNARYAAMYSSGLSESDKDEIAEFTEFFDNEFDDITDEERYENWGESDAFLLRLGHRIIDEKLLARREQVLSGLSEQEKEEVASLSEELFKIRKDKFLDCVAERNGDLYGWENFFPGTVPKKGLADVKRWIEFACAELIQGEGSATLRVIDDDKDIIMGIRVEDGIWVPISEQEMEDAYTLTPSGFRLAPEEGETFGALPPRDNIETKRKANLQLVK